MQYIKKLINLKVREGSRVARFILDILGYGGHWIRRAMNEDIDHFLQKQKVDEMSVAEISGHHFAPRTWGKYLALEYPQFDVCADTIEYSDQFDMVFCEQVLEHVWEPQKALKNIYGMLKPGGYLLVSTPFLVKIHKCPEDYWRFSPDCMRRMLVEAGYLVEKLESWGNRSCVTSNLSEGRWARYNPFRSLKNEPDLPVTIWAYAVKPE